MNMLFASTLKLTKADKQLSQRINIFWPNYIILNYRKEDKNKNPPTELFPNLLHSISPHPPPPTPGGFPESQLITYGDNSDKPMLGYPVPLNTRNPISACGGGCCPYIWFQ